MQEKGRRCAGPHRERVEAIMIDPLQGRGTAVHSRHNKTVAGCALGQLVPQEEVLNTGRPPTQSESCG